MEPSEFDIKEKAADQADVQYTERNKLDLAVPRRPFSSIVRCLHTVK